MRLVLVTLCGVGFAVSASAQQTPTVVQLPQATVLKAGTAVTAAPNNPSLEDIGFDAKVKRDPNGRIIKEGAAVNPILEANVLRSDSGSSMRSDSSINHPKITKPTAPATPTLGAKRPLAPSSSTGGGVPNATNTLVTTPVVTQ